MERPFTFGPSLFKAVDGKKISFHLRRCDNESEIREYIENGGGAVVDQFVSQRDPFTITLEDAMNSSAPPKGRDTFRPEFIIKCCARNKLVPLKPFSNNASKFSNEFDPNDVLLHKISWSEASKFCLEEMNAHAKKYQITKANGPQLVVKSSYTCKERQKIVEFIVKNNAYFDLKGVSFWKKMEPEFPNHTWQSLKQHFLKKVWPRIKDYGLDKGKVKMFKEGMNKRPERGRKNRYSSKEDNTIINYVKKYGANESLAGNKFWKEMQRREKLPGRTWQGVRERYLKHLKDQSSIDSRNHSSGDERPKVKAESSSDESLQEDPTGEDSSNAPFNPVPVARPQTTMLECLLEQERKRNWARKQEEMAELKSRRERNENASEGMIQEACEDLESMPDASTQDLFSMVDSPIHERSDVMLSPVIKSENFSPVVFEHVNKTETESDGEVGSSSAASDQVDEENSPWSPDGLRWTGFTQVNQR